MKRVEGTSGIRLIECVSPARNRWRIRWDVQEKENGSASYMEEEPQYRTFENLEELTDFYTKAMKHIQDTLADGWRKKDAFDPEDYRVE